MTHLVSNSDPRAAAEGVAVLVSVVVALAVIGADSLDPGGDPRPAILTGAFGALSIGTAASSLVGHHVGRWSIPVWSGVGFASCVGFIAALRHGRLLVFSGQPLDFVHHPVIAGSLVGVASIGFGIAVYFARAVGPAVLGGLSALLAQSPDQLEAINKKVRLVATLVASIGTVTAAVAALVLNAS